MRWLPSRRLGIPVLAAAAAIAASALLPDTADAKVGPAERVWLLDMADWADTMSQAFGDFSELASDSVAVTLLLLGDQETVIKFAVPIGTMQACNSLLKTTAGPPPTKRLQRIYNLSTKACGKFALAARRIARGIDTADASLLESALAPMSAGRRLMGKATKAINALV